jgi:hypothetical protein
MEIEYIIAIVAIIPIAYGLYKRTKKRMEDGLTTEEIIETVEDVIDTIEEIGG